MSVIQLNEHRPGSMKTLMIDITERKIMMLGVEKSTGELVLVRSKECKKIIDANRDEDEVFIIDNIIQDYNNSSNGDWETLRLDAYVSDETIDLIIN